jgi:F-type H+-transporting ATPase subunit epsilon
MTLKVELVSPTARVWSGEATSVSTRTIEGDIGILTDHTPLFAVLVDGKVVIHGINGENTEFNVSWWLSVSCKQSCINFTESVN